MRFYTLFESPLGQILLTATNKALTGLYLQNKPNISEYIANHNQEIFIQAIDQLNEYFAGERRVFTLALALVGTNFQMKVWQALLDIQYGETKSYGEIAQSINHPKAARAVGMANSKNPLSIIIPCHRVIGANGKLTGYSGGLSNKEWLLRHEEDSSL